MSFLHTTDVKCLIQKQVEKISNGKIFESQYSYFPLAKPQRNGKNIKNSPSPFAKTTISFLKPQSEKNSSKQLP